MIANDLLPLSHPVGILRLMPGNPRKGDIDAVMKSYKQFGQRKPIVATRDGTVIAGNHQLLAARKLGWQKIAVVFVDDDDKTAKAFALADNRTAELGIYDNELLVEFIDEVSIDPTLFEAISYSEQDIELLRTPTNFINGEEETHQQNDYSSVINPPQYEIIGEKPEVKELFDDSKTNQLIENINKIDVDEELRHFLLLAAQRHTVFNYRKIAEFYPHLSKENQRLMEESALIIIDLDDAIAQGFVRLTAEIEAIRKSDTPDV